VEGFGSRKLSDAYIAKFHRSSFGFKAQVAFGWIGVFAAGDFVAVDPQADFTVDRADVVEVPFRGWLGEVSFGVASRSVWRKGREGGEF
jgi:hypothetical protein